MKSYEIWAHPRTGEVYAFRLEDGRVTGCRGPLTMREVAEGDLSTFPYEELPEPVRRVGDSTEAVLRTPDWVFAGKARPRTGQEGNVLSRALERVAARRRVRH